MSKEEDTVLHVTMVGEEDNARSLCIVEEEDKN